MPNDQTADEWRAKRLTQVEVNAELLRDSLAGDFRPTGFALSDAAMRSIDALIARITMVIANADITFDVRRREAKVQALAPTSMPRLRATLQLVATREREAAQE